MDLGLVIVGNLVQQLFVTQLTQRTERIIIRVFSCVLLIKKSLLSLIFYKKNTIFSVGFEYCCIIYPLHWAVVIFFSWDFLYMAAMQTKQNCNKNHAIYKGVILLVFAGFKI